MKQNNINTLTKHNQRFQITQKANKFGSGEMDQHAASSENRKPELGIYCPHWAAQNLQ